MKSSSFNTRSGSLDLLKIIAIIMVIASHYFNVQFGNALINTRSFLGISTHLILSFVIVACNIFILITGYCCNKKESVLTRKIFRLILVTLFYGTIIAFLYIIFTRPQFNLSLAKTILNSIIDRWFIIFYIILYLLIPYINKAISNISKKSFRNLLLILLIFFSIWPTFLTDITLKDNGYGMVNFITIYLIGTYIQLYKEDFQKHKYKIYAFGFLSLIITTFFSFISYRAWNYCSIFVIIQSVAFFLFFKNIKMQSYHLLTRIASFSLGIYIIHENHLICKWIFQDLFNCKDYIGTWSYIPNFFFTVIGIFTICCIIDYFRELFFRSIVDKFILKHQLFNKEIKASK